MLELQSIKIPGGCYGGNVGQFGVLKNSSPTFQSCRETFQSQYFQSPISTHMIYVLNTNKKPEDIASFIKCFEDTSDIKDGAKFGLVSNYSNYVLIQLNWWQSQQIRFSLFTALIRAANNYPDLECAIQFEPYLKTTSAALSRFMEGSNFCYTNQLQWYSTFSNLNFFQVDNILMPEIEKLFNIEIIKKAKEINDIVNNNNNNDKRIYELCKCLQK